MPQKPYSIVFFGTSDFAVPVLQSLKADGDFSIVEVVSQPDRPAGRKKIMTAPAVKRAAETLGLPVYQPESVRDEDALAHFKNLGADAFVVVSYGKILPKKLLDIPAFGGVNVHASILPAYRGASPISAAIAAGEKETGVTIMVMDEKMDEGPILHIAHLPISDDDTTDSLTPKLAKLGGDEIVPTLKAYLSGALAPKPQEHAQASYTRILAREDGHMDWTKSATEIERFVRAMQPWPEAFTFWTRKGKKLKITIKKSEILHPTVKCSEGAETASVCTLADGTVCVNCGEGAIELLRIQLEGKNEMDAKAFVNGYPDFVGAVLA